MCRRSVIGRTAVLYKYYIMNYIIYKTTNLINGMYYIGCHQTNDLNDGYLGSGKHLKRAIKKYGVENFKFEILHSVASKEEMFMLERTIVNESLVKDLLSYNLKIGGSGGNPGIVGAFSGRTHTIQTKEKIRQAAQQQITSDDKRKKLSQNSWARRNPVAQREHASRVNSGKPKKSEHRKKLADAQTGKKMINNGFTSIWIKQEEVDAYLAQGWKLGRKK